MRTFFLLRQAGQRILLKAQEGRQALQQMVQQRTNPIMQTTTQRIAIMRPKCPEATIKTLRNNGALMKQAADRKAALQARVEEDHSHWDFTNTRSIKTGRERAGRADHKLKYARLLSFRMCLTLVFRRAEGTCPSPQFNRGIEADMGNI